MNINQRIQELLCNSKLTQKDLSSYISVAPSTLNNWIKLGRSIPAEYIIPICEFFGVSLEYLLTGKETTASQVDADKQKQTRTNNSSKSINNTYNGNINSVNNATGDNITIYSNGIGSSGTTTRNPEYNSRYSTIIMYLDSLDKKRRRHAIVDIEYMLEEELHIDKDNIKKSENGTEYSKILKYLDSLDDKKCRYTIVDIECMLEDDYNVKKNDR